MEQKTLFLWRILNHSVGEIVESSPIYTSSEEAVEAAKNYAARNIAAICDISITILNNEREEISEIRNIRIADIVSQIKSSKQNKRKDCSKGVVMAKKVSLINMKGGVGKSTLAVNLDA